MQERRSLQRFDLKAPAKIEIASEAGKNVLSLSIKNISSAGAFVVTDQPLPEGLAVNLELLLSLEMLQGLIGERGKTKIRAKGKVVRSNPDGMAIAFDSKYRIVAGNGLRY